MLSKDGIMLAGAAASLELSMITPPHSLYTDPAGLQANVCRVAALEWS